MQRTFHPYFLLKMSGSSQRHSHVTGYLILLVAVATLGPLQYGYHLAELNAPQDVITCHSLLGRQNVASKSLSNPSQCIPMTEAEFAALSSIYILGGLAGAITAGPISSSHGRLLTMRITGIFFILGSLIETIAESVPVMSTGRFLAGLGAGAATVVAPMYISEISPAEKRGLFGTMTQAMISVGIFVTQSLGYFFSRGMLWRIILGVGAGFGLLLGAGLCFIPESPSWLASHHNPTLAVKTLQRIRGAGTPIHKETAGWNVQEINGEEERLIRPSDLSSTSQYNQHNLATPNLKLPSVGFFGVLQDPLYRPAIMAVCGIMIAQQLSGINSIMMYSVSLLRGVLPIPSILLTIIMSAMNVITTIVCAPLADRIGRKSCLLLSIAGMGTMSLLLAISLRMEWKLFSAIAVISFVAFFATGLGPVPYIMASELVGQEAVGAAQSWALAANYLASFLVAQFFPLLNSWMNNRWGGAGWVYFIFTAFAGVSWIFVTYYVPETNGKTGPDEVWGRTTGEVAD
ncbi:unnamed protein product [Blumeria hordei]|uniref:Major facilitator superfamily (MFS) profile domain-containing protein n=1 Tax=Blumeria hordei TaxID=2867405 RepID=A0A383UST6_BLUHO|nr:unnamed protein product [Blumeria hordei]